MAVGVAAVKIQGDNKQLKITLDRSMNIMQRFGRRVEQVFLGVGLVILSRKIFQFAGKIAAAYRTQVQAERRLQGVLKATGHAAGFSQDALKQYASRMQALTGISDDVALNGFAILASFKNIRGEEFTEAAMRAADLSEVMGVKLNTAMTMVGKALNDPIRGLTSLSRIGVSFTEQQREQIKEAVRFGDAAKAQAVILEELKNEFGGAAEEVGQARGWEHLGNRLTDIGEKIVGLLIPALDMIMPAFEFAINGVELFINALTKGNEANKHWYAVGTMAMQGFVNSVIKAMAYASAAIFNWRDTLKVTWAGVKISFLGMTLMAVKFGNQIIHMVTNSSRALEFIGKQFQALGQLVWGILTDLGQMVMDFLSGKGVNMRFEGIERAFKTSLDAMEDMFHDRQKGGFELSLEKQFTKAVAESGMALKTLDDQAKALMPAMDMIFNPLSEFNEKRLLPDVPKPDMPFEKAKLNQDKKKGSAPGVEDLASLNARILKAAAKRQSANPVVAAVKELPTDIAKALGFKERKKEQKEQAGQSPFVKSIKGLSDTLVAGPEMIAKGITDTVKDGTMKSFEALKSLDSNIAHLVEVAVRREKVEKEVKELTQTISEKKAYGAVK